MTTTFDHGRRKTNERDGEAGGRVVGKTGRRPAGPAYRQADLCRARFACCVLQSTSCVTPVPEAVPRNHGKRDFASPIRRETDGTELRANEWRSGGGGAAAAAAAGTSVDSSARSLLDRFCPILSTRPAVAEVGRDG